MLSKNTHHRTVPRIFALVSLLGLTSLLFTGTVSAGQQTTSDSHQAAQADALVHKNTGITGKVNSPGVDSNTATQTDTDIVAPSKIITDNHTDTPISSSQPPGK